MTLGATGNTISGRVVGRQCVTVFDWHRLPLTGCRFDIRWVSGGGKQPTLCVFRVLRWRLWINVVTLAVTRNSFSGVVVGHQCVPVFDGH